ncbi:hypothetical protein JCM14124_30320 [Humidesulfovibrio idahonensis]
MLRFRGKTRNFDVFPAEQWPDQHGADLGLYRLCEYTWESGKRREKWFSIGGQKYTFITPEALGQLVSKGLTEPGWLEALERPAPKFKAKDWVRWYGPQLSARQFRLRSDPFLWVDGQWRVLIEDLRLGKQLVCCDELVLLDRFGKEIAR